MGRGPHMEAACTDGGAGSDDSSRTQTQITAAATARRRNVREGGKEWGAWEPAAVQPAAVPAGFGWVGGGKVCGCGGRRHASPRPVEALAYKRFLCRSGRAVVSSAASDAAEPPDLPIPLCICWKSATVPCRALMVAPCAVVNQSGRAASADAAEIPVVSTKTPCQPARCCNMPRGSPATAPPTWAMHLTKPPADDDRWAGVTSREKSPSST
mmetsp:Transcript_11280/g.37347  ORF Transcript_11280/g.37347 Transcript_11280/m.37347 type:complete len:212 (+) Transcript_11280:370-1005(+)